MTTSESSPAPWAEILAAGRDAGDRRIGRGVAHGPGDGGEIVGRRGEDEQQLGLERTGGCRQGGARRHCGVAVRRPSTCIQRAVARVHGHGG